MCNKHILARAKTEAISRLENLLAYQKIASSENICLAKTSILV